MSASEKNAVSKDSGKTVVFFYNDYESLGLEYISSVLQNAGIHTYLVYENLVDFYAFDSRKTITKERCGRIAKKICDKKPDVLALSLLTDTFQINMIVAEQVKALDPEIRIIAGGVHTSLLPQLVLGYPQIDAVAIGEGEYSVLCYAQNLDSLRRGVAGVLEGIVYKQNGGCVGNFTKFSIQDDLDSIPYPDKELFYREDASLKAHYFVQCSRGCPFVCSFCINDYLHQVVGGKRFRVRSPENILKELLWAKEKYSPEFVVLVDECFGFNFQWAKRFLELYKEKIRIPFLVSLHPHSVTAELADLLKNANCWYVAMGVQSLNEESSRMVLKRSLKREKVAQAIETIRSRGITLQCDHIFGIPEENEKDMLDALLFYNEHRPSLVSVYWLSYYPKSQITHIARKKGILSELDIENIEHGRLGTGIKRVRGHHAINFWMNYFSFFPKVFVAWIVRSGCFRLFNIRNFYISSAFPRVLRLLLNKKDWNRYYMKRILFKKLNNFLFWGPS